MSEPTLESRIKALESKNSKIRKQLHELETAPKAKTWTVSLEFDVEDRFTSDVSKPDLPLNAKVAKACGKELVVISGEYRIITHRGDYSINSMPVPDYHVDPTLAMGALEEYLDKRKDEMYYCHYTLIKHADGSGFIAIDDIATVMFGKNKSRPTAICESIVKHSEVAKK